MVSFIVFFLLGGLVGLAVHDAVILKKTAVFVFVVAFIFAIVWQMQNHWPFFDLAFADSVHATILPTFLGCGAGAVMNYFFGLRLG